MQSFGVLRYTWLYLQHTFKYKLSDHYYYNMYMQARVQMYMYIGIGWDGFTQLSSRFE